LSDMTRSRLGRRNPWILGGVLVGTVACVAIAFSESLLVIGICWALAQGGYNAALAAIIAVVPDRVPEHQRGRISALSGMAIYIALLLSSFILSTLNSGAGIFIIPAAIGLVTVLLFALTYDDRPTKSLIRSQGILEGFLGSFWVNPVKEADFGWAWVSRFMVIFGFSVLMTYQVYFLGDMLKVAPAGIGSIMFNSMLITAACVIASSFVSGWLSDRIGRRKVFVIGAATIYAIGIAILIFADTLALYYVSIAVSAVGFGVYFAVDQALVVDVLPDRETDAAKNLGVLNIANTVPQALAPAVAPIFLAIGAGDVGNYPLLYAVASIAAFLGAVSILPVKGVR
jgi:MFS family permease